MMATLSQLAVNLPTVCTLTDRNRFWHCREAVPRSQLDQSTSTLMRGNEQARTSGAAHVQEGLTVMRDDSSRIKIGLVDGFRHT